MARLGAVAMLTVAGKIGFSPVADSKLYGEAVALRCRRDVRNPSDHDRKFGDRTHSLKTKVPTTPDANRRVQAPVSSTGKPRVD